jgi:hypothetical protein
MDEEICLRDMTMQERTVWYMKTYGSISSLEAIQELGNTRLSGTIYSLKQKGYLISSEQDHARNRWGDTTTFARYRILSEPQIEEEIDEHKV